MLLARNQSSTLIADGDSPNAIFTYHFWRNHRLIVVNPNRPRHFRLDAKNREQLLALHKTCCCHEPRDHKKANAHSADASQGFTCINKIS